MLLAVENLRVSYEKIRAVQGLTFQVDEGEIVCIIGANGAGKSTLLRLLARVTVPDRGEIVWHRPVSSSLLALNVFLLLTSYSITRVVREPLMTISRSPEVRSYAAAGQALLLLVLVPAYGAIAARVPRRNLIIAVTSSSRRRSPTRCRRAG